MTEIEISDEIMGKKFIELAFDHCIKCSTCKYSYKEFMMSCPSGEKHLFESFWASGRIRTTRGLILGELEWNDDIKDVIFACPTCGACMDACQAPHADYIVDIIESLREVAVKEIGPAKNQEKLIERATNPEMWNPYGEPNSNNNDLKEEYNLPDKAEWVYFIGCTSNYRQKSLRDATLRFLKKANIDFTLIDEHCCTSPMLRTGQVEKCKEFMQYNIEKIEETGASKVITSCAGCYRTLKKDFKKFGIEFDFEVLHTAELINDLINENKIEFKSDFKKKVTYHDPCHLGRHMNIYEIPRAIYRSIPGLELVEMERNKNHSWCCGAGGGVKIGYPEWSLEISEKRLREARETEAVILSSTCPFCKTNLNDANEKFNFGFEVLDLIEIIDGLEYKVKN
ncbi:MAG: (Fe-S)-binding protein [Candidatus Lokiarchaeota archaeon]|nr:(Fe-S)-binding protein [Candidatus Lokiarchaeota archaeon]MBD3198915.1 (Fe-S)-binding protein [Candidatus Lokiarchaeota archaeon]